MLPAYLVVSIPKGRNGQGDATRGPLDRKPTPITSPFGATGATEAVGKGDENIV